jgi:hypothetical protein
MATIRREMGHFGIFHHVCFLARLVREGKGISEEALA